MKKLICAAAMSALCATVFAIESENIVGYQKITVPTGYSLFTVTFKAVSGVAYDIQDIVPYNGSAVVASGVTVQKMDASGSYLTQYAYRSAKGGWCKGLTLQTRGVVTFADGEAMCVNNSTGSEIQFQVSGEVELEPWSQTVAPGYALIGNMTPVAMDMQDIIPCNAETGNTISTGVTIQKLGQDGAYETQYAYRSAKGGWCKGLTLQERGVVTFEAGEAACVNNSTGSAIKLKFKGPVPAAE